MLFRVNSGKTVKLRDLVVNKKGSFDVLSEHDKVQPKVLDPDTYKGGPAAAVDTG